MESKDSKKNFKECLCIAHQTNTYQCDFYSKNGFAIHNNKFNSEIDNIINEIKNIKEDNIYLILETLTILERREFYEIILEKNKNIKIKTNNSLFLETICSIKENSNIQYNQAANFLTLQIPLNHILLTKNTDIDILSVLKNNNLKNGIFIKLEIEIFQSFSVLDKFRANLLETAEKHLPIDINALCEMLSSITHNFYAEYKEYLSSNHLINKIKLQGEQEFNKYIQENIKPAMKKIESYILSYTERKEKYLLTNLFFTLLLLPIDILLLGVGLVIAPLGVGPLLVSLGLLGLSNTYTMLDLYFENKSTSNEQQEINNLLSDLYFTVLLQSFGNSLKPLIEYEYKIRGNYIHTENSISIYSSYNQLNIYKNNNIPSYNIKYNYNKDIQKDSTFSSVFNEIYIENENAGKKLRQIHDRFIEIYQDKKDKIFNESINNLSQILYVETPLYTTPLLSYYLQDKVNSNMHKNITKYCNVIIFTNSLLSGQSPSVKHELTDKLTINPEYHISYGAGAEDYRRNYGMYDYADYDLMINKVQEETSKIYPMFFSCFKYKEKNHYIEKLLLKIEKIYNEYNALYNSMKNKVESWKIRYIEDRQVTLEFENFDFFRIQNYLEYNKKIPFIKKHIINYFAYYNDTVTYIKTYYILDDELNTHLNNLFNLTMEAYQSVSCFYTNKQLDDYDMYDEYKDFIKDQISEYFDDLSNKFETDLENNKNINLLYDIEYSSYKNIITAFIFLNFNIYDEYNNYHNDFYITAAEYYKYKNKLINTIHLNNIETSHDKLIFNSISKKILDLSLSILKEIVLTILFYSDTTRKTIKLLHNNKGNQYDLENDFEYGIIYYFLRKEYLFKNCHTNMELYNIREKQINIELYNIIKKYISYEVFIDNVTTEYPVDKNLYNDCKEYILNILTITCGEFKYKVDSGKYQLPLTYFFNQYLKHFNIEKTLINHYNTISQKEIKIDIEGKDILSEILFNADTIYNINKDIQTGNKAGVKRNLLFIPRLFAGILIDNIFQCIYNIPDKEKLKKYIRLYNYMHIDNKFLPPHTVINQHTVCMPIDITNNFSIFDNSFILFGDKNMDINSLINAYSLYANINDADKARTIFKERIKTYLTGEYVKGLDNVLLEQYAKEHNNNNIHGAGAVKAWNYIAKKHKDCKEDEPLDINIETIKNMLGLKDEELSDIINIKETYANGNNQENDEAIDTPATTVAKSFYQAVCFAEGYKPDFNLVPKKIKAIQSDSKKTEKRNSSFTESLHEIARQNLRSAYMQVDNKEFKGENQWEKSLVNQQPFIGIITLWVIPQNLIEE